MEDPDAGLFKGPWVQLRRPFRPAPGDVASAFDIRTPFHPFMHQHLAWLRLSGKNHAPKNTIVTTGTGSGKTECFLYPVLDHCLRAKKNGQKGVKAIVLYPMNALAADQEKRFAGAIWKDPLLKGAGIRVGNYTGRYDPADPGKGKDGGTVKMGPDHGISNHEVQQENPPDILLTNYRMLDFLLMRPQDRGLWQNNGPGTLKYLVLDELHTYDGAQGADVACLIRRLKERLGISKGELCVVGTSATLDDRDALRDLEDDGTIDADETGKEKLAKFAETLFEESIGDDAVIGEDRLRVENIVKSELLETSLPGPEDCVPRDDEDSFRYAERQSRLWGGPAFISPEGDAKEAFDDAVEQWELRLGEWLKGQVLFKCLLEIFQKAEQDREDPLPWTVLVERLAAKDFGLLKVSDEEARKILVASYCSLVARAREIRSQKSSVLVPTQVQLWIRELRRLGRVVSNTPRFSWLDEPSSDVKSLPAFHCSECGESGWVALHDPDLDSQINAGGVAGWALEDDPTKIYRGWFGRQDDQSGVNLKSQYIVVISPWEENRFEGEEEAKKQKQLTFLPEDGSEEYFFFPKSLVVRKGDGPCPLTGDEERFRVRIDNETRKLENGRVVGVQKCPRCGSQEGLFFIGAQSATLSSVAIDEMFGSVLNNDPKLLAFTDSVQDASHRAGFFSARTYHFTFRTALQHVVNEGVSEENGEGGIALADAGACLLDYWSRDLPGRPGCLKEAMTVLMPPDLQEYREFVEFRDHPALDKPPSRLYEQIRTRLSWQAASEFGLMQTHGRTMEPNGSSCLCWDERTVAATLDALLQRLPGVNPEFSRVRPEQWRVWLYGILHRYREKGALSHPYLVPYAKMGFWGKYPFGRAVEGRETFPPAIRYKPKLMATAPQRGHEHVLGHTRGGRSPWHVVWTYRALGEPPVAEADVLDLIRELLACGAAAGLLEKLHQDGDKSYFAISSSAARLLPGGVRLVCDETGRGIVRPEGEAGYWKNAPSMEYYAKSGRYRIQEYDARQRYYQDRYRKGALRRVAAHEHTGLLATEERERVENRFKKRLHEDDPNVLTCTSTLEMGIDIGDLSSTMLCSIPPDTASYLQRIGRAGRATGTALIVSVVNQDPHDLFFYARPAEMLKGRVDPPGCWLDASAVLVRQYLAFCFDTGTREGRLTEIPRTGPQLVEDMKNPDGRIPTLTAWIAKNERVLQDRFIRHFLPPVQDDTRERFLAETDTQVLVQRMHEAVDAYDRVRRDLENARKRLNGQLKQLDEEEKEARREIGQELKILGGRINGMGRVTALEIFTDAGLLPNYAFPEKGVRFYGAVYNKHSRDKQEHKPVEVFRSATLALRELAPWNTFYTHSRQFDIQQIAIGNPRHLLTETWAICGACGHMRRAEELKAPGALPACPQCGHSGDHRSQLDLGQQRQFIEFAQSQALSYMEHYESLSGDRNEERQRGFYDVVVSFDQTKEKASGAVGDDELPFGIEYRSSMILRDVNTGYFGEVKDVSFGPDTFASESGFFVCRDCGTALSPGLTTESADPKLHRRSCSARRKHEKMRQEGQSGNPYVYLPLYLYRELKSEAIRLLLPLADDEDIHTLVACIYLGLRLRFEGNPAHLIVQPQITPDAEAGVTRHYLVIMDAVPGGTGFLKTLYQEKDDKGRPGEGVMDVLRRARDAMETCPCRQMGDPAGRSNPDGCYRCIRTYHMQYKADKISANRGIRLLDKLIEAGQRRAEKSELEEIKNVSLFGSVLEKKFAESLRDYVEKSKGTWAETVVNGAPGYRFSLPGSDRIWELELQPCLGPSAGVMIPCRPDFALRCDDDKVDPLAIFTDGFEFHCHPDNRLADDLEKRLSVAESGKYRVWNIAWDDLQDEEQGRPMVCGSPMAAYLALAQRKLSEKHQGIPDAARLTGNGMEQLKAYLENPERTGWKFMAYLAVFRPLLQLFVEKRKAGQKDFEKALADWRQGATMAPFPVFEDGDWIVNDRATPDGDFVSYLSDKDARVNAKEKAVVVGRLRDGGEDVSEKNFKQRWRRFLACVNLFQFHVSFDFCAVSRAREEDEFRKAAEEEFQVPEPWQQVLEDTVESLKPAVEAFAKSGLPVPEVEYYNEEIDDDAFAEMAWNSGENKVAILAGEQVGFADAWRSQGWKIFLLSDIEENGVKEIANQILALTDLGEEIA